MTDTAASSSCSCKIGKATERYGLDGLDAELIRRHRNDDASLRELAAYINQRILAAALSDVDADLSDAVYGAVGDEDAVTVLYDALTADDVPADRTARVRTRLEQLDVDVAAIEGDWVTHPTVRKHLRECLDVETSRTATINFDDARDTIEWARTRCARVVNRTFERLHNAELVRTGDLEVAVTIQVTCTVCGNTYRPLQLFETRGCACFQNSDDRPTES